MSKANNAQAELVGRLRAFADIEDGGGTCDLQMSVSPSREAAAEIERMAGELERKNAALQAWLRYDEADWSDSIDDMMAAYDAALTLTSQALGETQ